MYEENCCCYTAQQQCCGGSHDHTCTSALKNGCLQACKVCLLSLLLLLLLLRRKDWRVGSQGSVAGQDLQTQKIEAGRLVRHPHTK